MGWQHRQHRQHQRHLALRRWQQPEGDGVIVDNLDCRYEAIDPAGIRAAILPQCLEREFHIPGRHRMAVMESGGGVEVEGHPAAVKCQFNTLRHQPVNTERLVPDPLHQRVIGQVHTRRRLSGNQERVETVEGAGRTLLQQPALRRIRVDVVEMGEVGSVFRRIKQGQPMHRLHGRSYGPGIRIMVNGQYRRDPQRQNG